MKEGKVIAFVPGGFEEVKPTFITFKKLKNLFYSYILLNISFAIFSLSQATLTSD